MRRECLVNLVRALVLILALAGYAGLAASASSSFPNVFQSSVGSQIGNPNPPGQTVKLIFIHHSCGENWLSDVNGGLGIALRDNNYFVSDTNYGWGPDGIGDHTDIGQWWLWFCGPNSSAYLNALYTEYGDHSYNYSRGTDPDPGRENQIIMFKSCFPNSHLGGNPGDPPTIGSNPLRGQDYGSEYHTVGNAKGIYNDLLAYFATRRDKLFIVITAPPLVAGDTDARHAANARALNDWLVNDWLDGYPYHNVAVFDFYNVLTSNGGNAYTNDLGWEAGNHHRWWNGAEQHIHSVANNFAAYGSDGDSHPTAAGNRKATAEFVQLLNVFYHRWVEDGGTPIPTATGIVPTSTATATISPTASSTTSPGQHTVIFQQGVSPEASYAGTTDVILARDVEPNVNLGGAENLEAFFGDIENRRSLMRWDLSALPASITINAASVELYRYGGDAASNMQLALYRLSRDWAEGTGCDFWPAPGYVPDGATWFTATTGVAWTAPGGDYDTTADYGYGPNGIVTQITLPAGVENGWIHLDATAIVRAWIEGSVPNYGLLLRPLSGEYTYHYFCSRNYSTPDLRPRLVITYTLGESATPIATDTGQPSPTSSEPAPRDYWLYLPIILKQ